MKVLESAIESLKKDMVADTVEDYMDLSFYVALVEEAFGVSDPSELMFYTAAVVHNLLEEGLVRAGELTGDRGLVPWDEDAGGAIERILSEWRKLGRTPHLWEIVWFEATEAGESYAAEVLQAAE